MLSVFKKAYHIIKHGGMVSFYYGVDFSGHTAIYIYWMEQKTGRLKHSDGLFYCLILGQADFWKTGFN